MVIILITGFLGSGKTRFVSNIISSKQVEQPLALLINDFGEEVVDGSLLNREGIFLEEVPGGCICCSSSEDFRDAFLAISQTQPATLIIESTGLADSKQICQEIAMFGFGVDAVLCIVDILSISATLQRVPTALSQIESADMLLLSKGDIATPEQTKKVCDTLRRLSEDIQKRSVPIVQLDKGRLLSENLQPFLRTEKRFRSFSESTQQHLFDDEITSFIIKSEETQSYPAIEAFLERVPSSVVRAKGFVLLGSYERKLQQSQQHIPRQVHVVQYIYGRSEIIPSSQNFTSSATKKGMKIFCIGINIKQNDLKEASSMLRSATVVQGFHFHRHH